MTKTIHDYKGRNIYHLIHDRKRYEFKIESLWAEVYSDVHPTAVGISVMCMNPQIIPPGVDGRKPISFVIYVAPSEIDYPQDLLRTLFDTLGVFLWEKLAGQSVNAMIVADEAVHLSNSYLAPPPTKWRAPDLFDTRAVLKEVRSRLEYDVEQLPRLTGWVSFTANMDKGAVGTGLSLSRVESLTGLPFSACKLTTFMTAFRAQAIPA